MHRSSAPGKSQAQNQTWASSAEGCAGPQERAASYTALHVGLCGREATEDTKQQCQAGHELGGRAQASFPSLTMTRIPLPSLPNNKPPSTTPWEDSTSPTDKFSPAGLPVLKVSASHWLGAGDMWVANLQLQPFSQQEIWGNSERTARDRKGLSFTVYHLQTQRRQKKRFVRGTVHCALQSRVTGPPGAVAMKGVQIGVARGLSGVQTAPWQSLGS